MARRMLGIPRLSPRQLSPIGVDVGGRTIKAVQLSRSPRGGWRVEATASCGRADVDAPFTAAEARRLAEVLRRRSFIGNRIVLAVPEKKLIVGSMELPARGNAGAALDAVARVEFARAYKCEQNGFEMAYWDLPASSRANAAQATNVMAVACPHSTADGLIDLCAEAELDVVGLDARPCAMARACAAAAKDAPGIVVLLELGWTSAVLVVVHRNIVVYERTISESALKNLVADIAANLRVEPQVAERLMAELDLLRAETPAPPGNASKTGSMADAIPAEVVGELRTIATQHFDALAREVTASVSYSSHQYPDAPVSRLLFLGGGALLPGVAEHLEGLLGFESRVVTPLATAAVAAPAAARDCTAALTTATGLAQFNDW